MVVYRFELTTINSDEFVAQQIHTPTKLYKLLSGALQDQPIFSAFSDTCNDEW